MQAKMKRITEIDFLRGIAIILMVTFHLAYDLNEFYNYNLNYETGLIELMGDVSALMFILLTGISCSLSRNNLFRGLKIILYALLITLVTYIYDANTYINFGILHLLGVSIIIYPLFKELNLLSLIVTGSLIIILGRFFTNINLAVNFFFALGLTSANYMSLDYYPLFPYLGVFLYGIALREIFYPHKISLLNFSLPPNPINYLGRHSLVVYLIHQPLILVLLYIFHNLIY